MNILLLGASGYLGGNIAHELTSLGHDVTCVVRSSSDVSRLEHMKVNFISNDMNSIEIFFQHNNVDWVINGVCTYKQNGTLYGDLLTSNVLFPLSVLNLAVKYKTKGFISIGTSLPAKLNIYSFSKNEFNRFGRFFSENEGITFINLELEMFFGGLHEPQNRFISSCKRKLENNEKLELTDGMQKRDIVRVEDVVGIIIAIISKNAINGYASLPVGSGESHSIREIILFMKEMLNSKSEIVFGAVPSRAGEPDTCANITWYQDVGYELKYDFWSGLREECKVE